MLPNTFPQAMELPDAARFRGSFKVSVGQREKPDAAPRQQILLLLLPQLLHVLYTRTPASSPQEDIGYAFIAAPSNNVTTEPTNFSRTADNGAPPTA